MNTPTAEVSASELPIRVRGVRVHNLQNIDLDIPTRQLVVFCGLSGSGKSSLAFDTLYAEGQRRYIESFSPYTRQFLPRLEKPTADRIENIRPAIAIEQRSGSRSNRSTVGTATEILDYLRLLFAKVAQPWCSECREPATRRDPQSVAQALSELPDGIRYQVCFSLSAEQIDNWAETIAHLQETGFVRLLVDGQTREIDQIPKRLNKSVRQQSLVVVDRLSTGKTSEARLLDSLEQAFESGDGLAQVLVQASDSLPETWNARGSTQEIDGRSWLLTSWSLDLRCQKCGKTFPAPEPRLFSFNHPLGACPTCEGFGEVAAFDWNRIVPDPSKTLREGAIAPWNTPAYRHELEELLALADAYGIPVDVPFEKLSKPQKALIEHGVPERNFGGLDGFFAWLERKKYKMHIRVFLSRWRSYSTCPTCHGQRLQPDVLAFRLGEKNIAEACEQSIEHACGFFSALELPDKEARIAKPMLDQIRSRLNYLTEVGLEYLTLDRTLRTLSGGESQRVALTKALGSSLVDTLYVLDEPSIGLHPCDTNRLVNAAKQLCRQGNSVVVVEHEEAFLRAADRIVEFGPAAGEQGGKVVFDGTPQALQEGGTLTGDFLAGRRGKSIPKRRPTKQGWLELRGAAGHNLQSIDVKFPLGVLCVVTGVSGAGKSTLVQETLYPALAQQLNKDAARPLPFESLAGAEQLGDAMLVDQSPIGRSPRSNPVTYIKVFDEIRKVFAETTEAKVRNYTAGHFSFNSEKGRCETCEGDGQIQIDMQFMPDVYMTCSDCHGTRYRPEILQVTHRQQTIADVLGMTVRQAFSFFHDKRPIQTKLQALLDVGLDYLQLGQPANTLSGGEAQRLKLAAYLASNKRQKCYLILDEPTTGLHFRDIQQLLECFDRLLSVGHSLLVVEHNLQVISHADYLIDIGPGPSTKGGQLIAHGTPEEVAQTEGSITGAFLRPLLSSGERK